MENGSGDSCEQLCCSTADRRKGATFSFPLDLKSNDVPMCRIMKVAALARVGQACKLVILDEAPMMSRLAYEALG